MDKKIVRPKRVLNYESTNLGFLQYVDQLEAYANKLEAKINYTLCSTELLDFEQWREKQVILPDTAGETLEEYFKWKAIT